MSNGASLRGFFHSKTCSCAGLEALRQGLRGPRAAAPVLELLLKTPELSELQEVWETELTVRLLSTAWLATSVITESQQT